MEPVKAAAIKEAAARLPEGMEPGIEGLRDREARLSEFDEASKKAALEPDTEKAKRTSLEAILEENRIKAAKAGEGTEGTEAGDADSAPACAKGSERRRG